MVRIYVHTLHTYGNMYKHSIGACVYTDKTVLFSFLVIESWATSKEGTLNEKSRDRDSKHNFDLT